jgi:hypothetical protein
MRSRKAFTEAQFHWIFILIVGTIILSFFISVVMKQKDVSESKVAIAVVQDLETITTGAGISTGTAQYLDKPDFDLYFSCPYCLCEYELKGNSRQLGKKVLFGTKVITGKKIVSWTKDWEAPFRITNFLFMTSPYTKYYIIYNQNNQSSVNLMKYINRTLPTKVNKEIMELTTTYPLTFPNLNFPEVRVVYLNVYINPPFRTIDGNRFSQLDIADEYITAVNVKSEYPFEYGEVSFYVKDGNNWVLDKGLGGQGLPNVDFVGDESIYAAMFAHGYDMYVCNMKLAYEHMKRICDIYEERTTKLYSNVCTSTYNDAVGYIQQLKWKSGNLSKNMQLGFNNYISIMDELDRLNHQLVVNGCVPIY